MYEPQPPQAIESDSFDNTVFLDVFEDFGLNGPQGTFRVRSVAPTLDVAPLCESRSFHTGTFIASGVEITQPNYRSCATLNVNPIELDDSMNPTLLEKPGHAPQPKTRYQM
jgi:hypothetical protein